MRTRYTGYTDIQETVSFAQHPCGSDCKSRQYRCFLKRKRFQAGFEGGETWGIMQRFGEEIPGHRFPYLLSLMRGTVMRPASAERREREG